jgi:hypothetical protein
MAVKSLRVTAIAAIVLAPHHTKSSSIQIFSDSGTPTSHPFSPLVLYQFALLATHVRRCRGFVTPIQALDSIRIYNAIIPAQRWAP